VRKIIHLDMDAFFASVELLRYPTTTSDGALRSLADVKSSLKDGQEHLWYFTSVDKERIGKAAALEGFKKRGWEVILMSDPVDEWVVMSLRDVEGTALKNAATGELPPLPDEDEDPIAKALGHVLSPTLRHRAVRAKNVLMGAAIYRACKRWPESAGARRLGWARRQLPAGYDVERHFKPSYAPWDQRLCLVPDGDFFRAIRAGRASVVTDRIETFDETGIRLQSGEHLDADVIVTATGLELRLLAGLQPVVDGEPVVLSQRMPYKGMMLAGVPNLVMTFGYVNASWTLRADLVSQWVVRLLARMDALGARIAVPRPTDGEVGTEPFSELSSGYFRRALDRLPMQSARAPWRFDQNYLRERRTIGRDAFDDGVLRFEGATAAGVAAGATTGAAA
jgi:hypothetical protein